MFEHKGKWWHQTEREACGACEEPIWETPIRDREPRERFPRVFPSFRRHLRGNVKHVWVAWIVRVAGYGLTATKTHTCGPGCWVQTLLKLLREQGGI